MPEPPRPSASPARDPLVRRLALAGASAFLALALCETALRLAWHNPYRHEVTDHVLKLALHHPNTDHLLDRSLLYGPGPRARLRTDSRSYILPSRRHERPDLTIVFLGGSTTECAAVLEEQRIHALVAARLEAMGLRVNALNAARSGNSLQDSLNVLLNHVVVDQPDIVIVMHATNDTGILASDAGYQVRMGHPVRPGDLARWVGQMLSTRSYLISAVRKALTGRPLRRLQDTRPRRPEKTDAPSPDPFRQRLVAFVRLSRALGMRPVLMTEPLSPRWTELTPEWAHRRAQDAFNAIIREVGEAERATVIDLVRYLRERVPGWDEPMRIFYDGMHVTDEGSARYADHIVERLLEEGFLAP